VYNNKNLYFLEENLNASVNSPINLINNSTHEGSDKLQAFAMLDLNVIKSKTEFNLSKITYAVFENSLSFEYNSSLLQNGDFKCSNIKSSQIISNVIMIRINTKFTAEENFVQTKFRTLKVSNEK